MKKITIGINNGSLTSPNLGVQALTYSSIKLLFELFKEQNILLEFYLFDSYKRSLSDVIRIGEDEISCKSVTFVMTKKFYFDEQFKKTIVSNWKKCDLIWDIGGGDSWSDIYGKKRFFVSFLSLFKIIQMKKPIILPPQTIGPFKNKIVKSLANFIMRKCLKVYPRDERSAQYLKVNLPNCKFLTVPDMALFLPYTRNERLDSKYINIGLNVSGLLYNGGYTRNNQFSLSVDYQKLIDNIILSFHEIDNVKIHLIPHVVEEQSGKVEDDVWASLEVKKKFPFVIVPFKFSNSIEAKSYISGLDFFMGARMHSTIAAFSSGVPVVPMAYSRKFSGLFCDTLGYDQMVDMKTMDDNTCLSIIQNAFERRILLKNEIDTINLKLKQHKIIFNDALLDDFKRAKLI